MKRQTWVLCLWALAAAAIVPARAQEKLNKSLPLGRAGTWEQAPAPLCACLPAIFKTTAEVAEPDGAGAAGRPALRQARVAGYDYPVGLRNLGMIDRSDNACCNFLSFNKTVNGDAYMWAPMGEIVSYIDNSSVSAVDYHWYIPGADVEELETQDADATYGTSGIYPFPTMTVKDGAGKSHVFTAPGTLKVGGTGEICTSDMLNLGTDVNDPAVTAVIGQRPFVNELGYLGGTNAMNLVGYGNLFMIAHPEAFITAVRAYLPAVPKHEEGAKLLMQIWYPLADEGNIQLRGLPLEAVSLPMSEIKETADTKMKNAAVAEFELSEPLEIGDKPFFLVTIEGFGTDPAKEDFRLYIDLKPVEMDEASAGNLLAHNSFCRLEGEDDYLRPINYFGAGLGESFMICPVIDTRTGEGSGVGTAGILKPAHALYRAGVLSLSSEGADLAVVYNVGGREVVRTGLTDGRADVAARLAKGVYLVRFMTGGKMSGAAKLLCNENLE